MKARGTLVYDGGCGLCQRSVAFARRHGGADLDYQAAASTEGKTTLDACGRRDEAERTVVWVRGRRSHAESAAIVRLLWSMAWPWRVAGGLLWLVPKPLRDAGYRLVAHHRHRLGRKVHDG